MVGRKRGRGVVEQSHRNSEEKQRLIPGRTDTDGSGQTVIFFIYHLFLFLYHLYHFLSPLNFVFVSFSLLILYCSFYQKYFAKSVDLQTAI